MQAQGLAVPPVTVSEVDRSIVLALFATLAAACFGLALVLALRTRDVLPAVVCIGALVCALNEPIY